MNPEPKDFTDDDLRRLIALMPQLYEEYRVLIVLCVCLGMRPREIVSIEGEMTIDGHRCVLTGTKSVSAFRRIVLPQVVSEQFPPIVGQLFADAPLDDVDALTSYMTCITSNCAHHMKKAGMVVPKALYSGRHRAKTMIRCRTDKDIQQWLLGHDRTAAEDYYGDFPAPELLVETVERVSSVFNGLDLGLTHWPLWRSNAQGGTRPEVVLPIVSTSS